MNRHLLIACALLFGLCACSEQKRVESPEESAAVQAPAASEDASAITLISAVQGNGEASPLAGEMVTVEAIVTVSYQTTGIRGYYIQEESSDFDTDDMTSEGLFVYDDAVGVQPGQKVRVTGTIEEFKGQTQMGKGARTVIVSEGETFPVDINLPLESVAWERYENMLVRFPQELTVTDTYTLGRYGEIGLSQGGRLYHSTQIARPGEESKLIEEMNRQRRVLLDDGETKQNPAPVPYLGDDDSLRCGSTIEGLTAVVSFMFDQYRLQPVGEVHFKEGARPQPPKRANAGELRVASANVLNYFNGDGQGGGFPTSRGASNAEELQRQRAKMMNALSSLNADIIGLNEVENDGYGETSALQDIVNGLNEKSGGTAAWKCVHPSFELGTDQIKVALIYNSNVVEALGEPATTNEEPFGNRRPPLAQSFTQKSNGESLTIAINHFKSKGSGNNAAGDNADKKDGQGAWNGERRQAAITLANWLGTDPTKSNDPDVLIIGDLNSYAMEDPIYELEQAGYVNLEPKFGGPKTYSYAYGGEFGSLDHALANPNLLNQVKGSEVWHINSDEPIVLDYNTEFNPPELYSPEPWKASDHDPIVVDLMLGPM